MPLPSIEGRGGNWSGVVRPGIRRIIWSFVGLLVAMMFLAGCTWLGAASEIASALQDAPTPTADPLDIPVLPENPTQVEIGRFSYYYNCMPCHGDHGQGLTDEWRATWVEDHQNCWARGCHSGRLGDEGFPLPDTIPAVAGVPGALDRFSSPELLYEYLKLNHPLQRPGGLPEEEYQALTAFLLAENGQELPGLPSGMQKELPLKRTAGKILAMAAAAIFAVFAGWFWLKRHGSR
jgi:hypothetical protein